MNSKVFSSYEATANIYLVHYLSKFQAPTKKLDRLCLKNDENFLKSIHF